MEVVLTEVVLNKEDIIKSTLTNSFVNKELVINTFYVHLLPEKAYIFHSYVDDNGKWDRWNGDVKINNKIFDNKDKSFNYFMKENRIKVYFNDRGWKKLKKYLKI